MCVFKDKHICVYVCVGALCIRLCVCMCVCVCVRVCSSKISSVPSSKQNKIKSFRQLVRPSGCLSVRPFIRPFVCP